MTRRLLSYVVLAGVLSAASLVSADGGKIDGIGTSNIQLVTVKDGKLVYTQGGRDHMIGLDKVSDLSIEKLRDFDDAEDALTKQEYKKAAAAYARALGNTGNKDQLLLVKARAIKALEQDGQWTEAVRYFLDVYQASPTAGTFALRPTKMPATGSKLLGESAGVIDGRLKTAAFKADDVQKNLKTMLLEIYTQAKDPKAADLAKELGATVSATPTADPGTSAGPDVAPSGGSARDVEALIAAKKFDEAVKTADAGLRTAQGESAAALFMAKGRALQGANKPDEAAVAFLRIYAHYPASPLAPLALMNAANIEAAAAQALKADASKAAEATKREDAAKRLFKEIVEKYPNSTQAQAARTRV